MSSSLNQTPAWSASEPPAHVREFLRLTDAFDKASREKDETAKEETQKALDIFFGQLESERQEDIRIFVLRQNTGRRIEANRSRFHRMLNGVMQFPVDVTRTAADTIPELTQETARLVLKTIGHLGAGLYKGGKAIGEAFKQAA